MNVAGGAALAIPVLSLRAMLAPLALARFVGGFAGAGMDCGTVRSLRRQEISHVRCR